MADKTRAPRKYDTLPEKLEAVRFEGTDHAVTLDFVKTELKKKQKDAPPRFALMPPKPKNDEDLQKIATFIGHPEAGTLLSRALRSFSQRWSFNAHAKSDGIFVPDDFKKMAAQFSARGETKTALKEEYDELSEELISLFQDQSIDVPTRMSRGNEITLRMKDIKEALDRKEFKEDVDDDEEEENGVAASATA